MNPLKPVVKQLIIVGNTIEIDTTATIFNITFWTNFVAGKEIVFFR